MFVPGLILAADVGASRIRVGLFDESLRLLKVRVSETPRENPVEGIPRRLREMVVEVVGGSLDSVRGVGVASIGLIDHRRGMITHAPNIPGRDVRLFKELSNIMEAEYFLLNDCNAAALGEWWPRRRETDSLTYITISTGIGGGVVDKGRLVLGKDGNAVEIGHIVIDPSGYMRCGCGGVGHWEAYCSGANLPRYVKRLLEDGVLPSGTRLGREAEARGLTSERIYRLYYEGDEAASKLFERLRDLYASGIASVINSFDPEILVIGGSIALGNKGFFSEEVYPRLGKYLVGEPPKIDEPIHGEHAPLYGAALTVHEDIEDARVREP